MYHTLNNNLCSTSYVHGSFLWEKVSWLGSFSPLRTRAVGRAVPPLAKSSDKNYIYVNYHAMFHLHNLQECWCPTFNFYWYGLSSF